MTLDTLEEVLLRQASRLPDVLWDDGYRGAGLRMPNRLKSTPAGTEVFHGRQVRVPRKWPGKDEGTEVVTHCGKR